MNTAVHRHLAVYKASNSRDSSGRWMRETFVPRDPWSALIPLEEAVFDFADTTAFQVVGNTTFSGNTSDVRNSVVEIAALLHEALLNGGARIRFAAFDTTAVWEKQQVHRELLCSGEEGSPWSSWSLLSRATGAQLCEEAPAGAGVMEFSARMPLLPMSPHAVFCLRITGDLRRGLRMLLPHGDGDKVGPYAEGRPFTLWRELQQPGVQIYVRYKPLLDDMAAMTCYSQLLRQVNYAFNDRDNGGYRPFVVGTCLPKLDALEAASRPVAYDYTALATTVCTILAATAASIVLGCVVRSGVCGRSRRDD